MRESFGIWKSSVYKGAYIFTSLSNTLSNSQSSMDWKKFTFAYRLDTSNLFGNLVSIEAFKEASLNLVFPSEWQHQLDRLNRVRAVRGDYGHRG